MTALEDLDLKQAVWVGSSVGAVVVVLILVGVACRCRSKRQQTPSATSDDPSIVLRFFGGSSSKEGGASGRTAVDQTESTSEISSSGWESSDDESSSSASSSWSYNFSLKDKDAEAVADDLENGEHPTTTTRKEISDSRNNGHIAAVQPALVRMTCPISRSRSDLVDATNSSQSSYKTRRASFGAVARRILAESGGQPSRRDLDDSSIYSGSTLSIFGGSSMASEDAAGHHGQHQHHTLHRAQSMPPVLTDAVADWFAFKQEAGLHDEDTEIHRRRSSLEGKTLHPMRVQL